MCQTLCRQGKQTRLLCGAYITGSVVLILTCTGHCSLGLSYLPLHLQWGWEWEWIKGCREVPSANYMVTRRTEEAWSLQTRLPGCNFYSLCNRKQVPNPSGATFVIFHMGTIMLSL